MTKEGERDFASDELSDPDAGAPEKDGEPKARPRRKMGMRVPSDNVPRRTDPNMSVPAEPAPASSPPPVSSLAAAMGIGPPPSRHATPTFTPAAAKAANGGVSSWDKDEEGGWTPPPGALANGGNFVPPSEIPRAASPPPETLSGLPLGAPLLPLPAPPPAPPPPNPAPMTLAPEPAIAALDATIDVDVDVDTGDTPPPPPVPREVKNEPTSGELLSDDDLRDGHEDLPGAPTVIGPPPEPPAVVVPPGVIPQVRARESSDFQRIPTQPGLVPPPPERGAVATRSSPMVVPVSSPILPPGDGVPIEIPPPAVAAPEPVAASPPAEASEGEESVELTGDELEEVAAPAAPPATPQAAQVSAAATPQTASAAPAIAHALPPALPAVHVPPSAAHAAHAAPPALPPAAHATPPALPPAAHATPPALPPAVHAAPPAVPADAAPAMPVAPPAPPADAPAAPTTLSAQPELAAKPKRRRGKSWFEEVFDEDYLRTLPFLTPATTQRESTFIAESLSTQPGAQLLDLGCGYGRHAMELAARGYQLVGVDLSLPLLIRGADEAQRRGLTINFVHGDMRELAFDEVFDGAYCWFTSFGYFDDEANRKVVQGVARALKTGARFLIEVVNRDYVIGEMPLRVWWEGDGCVVLEEVDFNFYTSRLVSQRSVVFEDSRQVEQEISIRAYALHELGKLLHQCGFRVLEVSGSIATRGRFFGGQSRNLIILAEKRPQADKQGTSPGTLPPAGPPSVAAPAAAKDPAKDPRDPKDS